MDQYRVEAIPLSKIYSDDSFNCRHSISPMDVSGLAQSIKENGLQFPITVQPVADVQGGLPAGFDFRIIAGHRRYKAHQVLATQDDKFKVIPAMLKIGLTEADARILNLSENLDRKELNILEEARAIQALQKAGIPRDHVAARLKVSSGWVQTRYYLLTLPEEIQLEAAAGFINQLQIKQLYSLDSVDAQFAAVRKIKEAKLRGEKVEHVGKKKKVANNVRKARGPEDITEMSELIAKSIGYGLHTRALAWAAGFITTDDLYADIRKEAEANGKTFKPPQ